MLCYALVFLVITLMTGIPGFGSIAAASAGIAQIPSFLILACLAVWLYSGLFRRA